MNVPFYIARRFFFRRGKRAFIHGISWLSVLTLALGLMALTVGLSTFNGLEQLLKSRFENFAADLRVTPTRGKFFGLGGSVTGRDAAHSWGATCLTCDRAFCHGTLW